MGVLMDTMATITVKSLLDELDDESAFWLITDLFGKQVEGLLYSTIPSEFKEGIMEEVLAHLKEAGIKDISYELLEDKK